MLRGMARKKTIILEKNKTYQPFLTTPPLCLKLPWALCTLLGYTKYRTINNSGHRPSMAQAWKLALTLLLLLWLFWLTDS